VTPKLGGSAHVQLAARLYEYGPPRARISQIRAKMAMCVVGAAACRHSVPLRRDLTAWRAWREPEIFRIRHALWMLKRARLRSQARGSWSGLERCADSLNLTPKQVGKLHLWVGQSGVQEYPRSDEELQSLDVGTRLSKLLREALRRARLTLSTCH
jgi:hypothetical protein